MNRFAYFKIPTQTFPKEITEISDGIICFKSNAESDLAVQYSNCTGLLIDVGKHEAYSEVLSNYIISLNLFRQEHISIQWLAQLEFKKYLIEIEPERVAEFIQENLYKEDRRWAYDENFNEVRIHNINNVNLTYSFTEVYHALSKLERGCFLDNALRYLAINHCIAYTPYRIYDNALLENATLFQLFEALMNEYDPVDSNKTDHCKCCNRPIRLGLSKRIKQYLNKLGFKDDSVFKSLDKIANTRHKFFHHLKGKSLRDYTNDIIKNKEDNYISFDEELEKGDGVLLAKGLLKTVITLILLEELLKTSPNSADQN